MINKEQSEKKQGHCLEGTGVSLTSGQTWGRMLAEEEKHLQWLWLETFKITDDANVYVVETLISLPMRSGLSQKKIKSTE